VTEAIDPIEVLLEVPAPPAEAFAAFTTGMGDWWDAAYTPDPPTWTGIDVAPVVGGEVAMRHGTDRWVWGRVTSWEPGRHYGQSFWLAHDPAHPSSLDVVFAPAGTGTAVRFRHGGWVPETAAAREKFGDWRHLLGRYAAHVG